MASKSHLIVSTSAFCLMMAAAPAYAQSSPPDADNAGTAVDPSTASSTPTAPSDDVRTIVVTGQTSKGRKLQSASSDITLVTNKDIQDKAPRNLASLLEMVPGVFVENSAGNIDNNYEVRGLPGGAGYGIGWEEDGLAWRYHGDNDNYFAVDLNVDHAEAIRGGAATVLSVNAPGALFNIITRRPNFDHFQGMVRVGGATYGEERADLYLTGPITNNLAFNVSGYIDSTRGQRVNPFTYKTYHLKGSLEYKLPNGGRINLAVRAGHQSDPYYATVPFYKNADGSISGVPGFDEHYGNLGGRAFAGLNVPSTYFDNPSGLRQFNYQQGSRIITKSARIDVEYPLNDHWTFNSKTRYTYVNNHLNALYPGGTGNQALQPAVNYLDLNSAIWCGGISPAYGPMCAGYYHFPGVAQFGLRNLQTGAVIPASDVSALNSLNGNGLLGQTVIANYLNWGGDFGTKDYLTYEDDFGKIHNSLTFGLMYFSGYSHVYNQTQGWSYLTDVRSNANIYDIVAIDASNNVLGAVTNHGIDDYGWWGNGVSKDSYRAMNYFFNDEMKIGEKLHLDFGLREEVYTDHGFGGNSSYGSDNINPYGSAAGASPWMWYTVNTYWDAWNGTYNTGVTHFVRRPWTVGANYEFTHNIAAFARVAKGYSDDIAAVGLGPTAMRFVEGGARYYNHDLAVSVDVFDAVVKHQGLDINSQLSLPSSVTDPSTGFQGASLVNDYDTRGFELDFEYRPVRYFGIEAQSTFQKPKITHDVVVATYNVGGAITTKNLTGYGFDGKTPTRTPHVIYSIKPTFYLPHNAGEIFAIYHYNGHIFADEGNSFRLPGNGRTEVGVNLNITPRINFTATVDNVFNVVGLTEGNPRGPLNDPIQQGYFYGRSIPGRNANFYLTYKF